MRLGKTVPRVQRTEQFLEIADEQRALMLAIRQFGRRIIGEHQHRQILVRLADRLDHGVTRPGIVDANHVQPGCGLRKGRQQPVDGDAIPALEAATRQGWVFELPIEDIERVAHRPHIRNTPNAGRSEIGALSVAANASPNTSRVCAGSMMPSSHSRAVACQGLPSSSYF